jgi:poly(A) polymerase
VGPTAADVRALLAEPFADELTRGGALRFAALFHDLGKPETRAVGEGGRILFIGHDRAGARLVRELCSRLRASRRLADYLANLTLNHLRLGFLVHKQPLSRRHVYDYLLATEPDSVDVTMLTVADRLATQGERTRREAVDAHLELARAMIAEALAWRRSGPPRSPIPGDELASELGIEPGPELGRLLGEIEAAVFAGEVSKREEAVDLAKRVRSH